MIIILPEAVGWSIF